MAGSFELVRTIPLVCYRLPSTASGAGGNLDLNSFDAQGYQTIRGYFFNSGATATLRIRMGPDGTTFPLVYTLLLDPAQAANTFTFNLAVMARFITFEFTNGGGATTVHANVELVP